MKIALVLIFAVLMQVAAAKETGQVHIYKLHYEKNELGIVTSIVVPGFAPDYRLQPEKGYEFLVTDRAGKKIYSFRFVIPLVVFTDREMPALGLSGGPIVLNETDFAIVTPQFEEEDSVIILDEQGKAVLRQQIRELAGPEGGGRWWVWVVVGVGLVAAIFLLWRISTR